MPDVSRVQAGKLALHLDHADLVTIVTESVDMTNALKYSATDRPVNVGIEIEPEHVRVWVRDQGPGLPLEEQEHIWERFHRVKWACRVPLEKVLG